MCVYCIWVEGLRWFWPISQSVACIWLTLHPHCYVISLDRSPQKNNLRYVDHKFRSLYFSDFSMGLLNFTLRFRFQNPKNSNTFFFKKLYFYKKYIYISTIFFAYIFTMMMMLSCGDDKLSWFRYVSVSQMVRDWD